MTGEGVRKFNQRNTRNTVGLALILVREDWYTYHRDGRITRISYERAPFAWEPARPTVVNPQLRRKNHGALQDMLLRAPDRRG